MPRSLPVPAPAPARPIAAPPRALPFGAFERLTSHDRDPELAAHVSNLIHFLVAALLAAGERTPTATWVRTSPFPWLAALPPAGIDEFAQEMLPSLLDALRDDDPCTYSLALTAWQASCRARDDRSLARAVHPDADACRPTRTAVSVRERVEPSLRGPALRARLS